MAVDGDAMLRFHVARKPWLKTALFGGAAALSLTGLVPVPEEARELVGPAEAEASGCPSGMASIGGKFCIDKFEASTEEGDKNEKGKFVVSKRHSPYRPVTGLT